MKNSILFITSLLFFIVASAQTYPFSEGFHGMPSGQVPAGWLGDIPVLSYHGQNEEKGLAAEIGGGDLVDSIISPLIGPLTSMSTLIFYYRIIDKNIYPSTPTNLEGNDRFEVKLSSDGVNYQTILQIDENNHNPSFNFSRKKIVVAQYAGFTINLKFVCTFGAGASYFVDIDSIRVYDDPTASISNLSSEVKITLFPNPVSQSNVCTVQVANNEAYNLNVYDILGNNLYSTKGNGNMPIPTTNLSPGLYMVQVKQNGKTHTQKLVIQ